MLLPHLFPCRRSSNEPPTGISVVEPHLNVCKPRARWNKCTITTLNALQTFEQWDVNWNKYGRAALKRV
ncbi:hypothetical protein PCCS19_52740 [Paenibacillus sp. CCS19]|nr:hypothetical protein PCCS19_52740 [Paenibacillus cellulosilyticus]